MLVNTAATFNERSRKIAATVSLAMTRHELCDFGYYYWIMKVVVKPHCHYIYAWKYPIIYD